MRVLGYKLCYTVKEKNWNGVGILVDNFLKENVVDVKRVGNMIIHIKLVLRVKVINIISTYEPQVGLL